MKEHLEFVPAAERPDLAGKTVLKAVGKLPDILVGKIDPAYMNGQDLSGHYDVNLEDGVNCIIVKAKKGETEVLAAVLIPVGYRADLNGTTKKVLDAKKISMAPLEEVLEETKMEYGSITPVGLPSHYRILIDSNIMGRENVVVGGGRQVSKLLVPTKTLNALPNAEIIEGLAYKPD